MSKNVLEVKNPQLFQVPVEQWSKKHNLHFYSQWTVMWYFFPFCSRSMQCFLMKRYWQGRWCNRWQTVQVLDIYCSSRPCFDVFIMLLEYDSLSTLVRETGQRDPLVKRDADPNPRENTAHVPLPSFKSNALLWHTFKKYLEWLRCLVYNKQLVYMTEHNTCCKWRNFSHMELTIWRMIPGLVQAALFPIKKT